MDEELAVSKRLEPYRPGKDGPWDYSAAAHLARRMTFGAPRGLVEKILAAGQAGAPALLLADREETPEMKAVADSQRGIGSTDSVQTWWAHRMLRGNSPARDKLALFWHDHFATSDAKVNDARLMMDQVRIFLRDGPGQFPSLLWAIAKDPAMIIWLDGNSNRRGKPNENFSRELMELFSLGIGNYTEKDIKEAARAFTGWHVKNREFWFNRRAHDTGTKTIFGKTGDFIGEDVVGMCFEKRESCEFIAGKLFDYYVGTPVSRELRKALGELYATSFRNTGVFLAKLLSSREFYSAPARRAIVSSPADFAIGTLRTLGATAGADRLPAEMSRMGMDILRPPSVKGWQKGESWLNSSTLLARYRFASMLTSDTENSPRIPWDRIEKGKAEGLFNLFFPGGLDERIRRLVEKEAGQDLKLMVTAIVELPEHQYI
ncbi:MAG: hypothetical protein CMJ99_09895 [Planctomycetes bacterium]|nr:hypothetical protein [Planctomycetota bacterium]